MRGKGLKLVQKEVFSFFSSFLGLKELTNGQKGVKSSVVTS